MKKIRINKELIEGIEIAICLMCIAIFAIYHLPFVKRGGIPVNTLYAVWNANITVIMIVMSLIISQKTTGLISKLFKWPIMSYFALQGIYLISVSINAALDIQMIWHKLMIAPFIAGLLTIIIHECRRKNN